MPLKKREISTPGTATGAGVLPDLMASFSVGECRTMVQIPLDELQNAPADWNFYAPLSDDKMIELIDSIRENGLLHPIVVWETPKQRKTVLSGHNRVRAYRALYEKTGEAQYRTIAATVLRDLTTGEARQILIDANWVQRSLTPSEKARSIAQKYLLTGRKARSENGTRSSRYEEIAAQYGLSARQVARYVRLARLEPCLQTLVDAGKLPIGTALKLVEFPPEKQKYLSEYWADRLRSKQVARLRATMTTGEMDDVLQEDAALVQVTIEMPAALERRFRRMAATWLSTFEDSV